MDNKSGPGSYTKGMPSRGQSGAAMNDSFAQHSAQTPSPLTGSRHATQSVGSAISNASRAACVHAPRQASSAPRNFVAMGRIDAASASIAGTLAPAAPLLKHRIARAGGIGETNRNGLEPDHDPRPVRPRVAPGAAGSRTTAGAGHVPARSRHRGHGRAAASGDAGFRRRRGPLDAGRWFAKRISLSLQILHPYRTRRGSAGDRAVSAGIG